MKKVFFALLFLSVAGAGVLVWLIRSAPPAIEAPKDHALQIIDEKHEEAGKAAEKAEGHEEDGEAHEEGESHGDAKAVDHGAEHAAAPEAHGEKHDEEHAEKAEAKGHGDASKSAAPALSLATEPPMAKVWVDGKYRGTTPLEIGLKDRVQKVEIKSDGFEDFSREAPSLKESGQGQLNWRIQLKQANETKEASELEHAANEAASAHEAKPQAAAHHAPTPKAKPKAAPAPKAASHGTGGDGLYRHGRVGPFLIQFKSLPRLTGEEASIQGQIARYRQELGDDKVFGCPVDLKEKGPWVRIVAGPFPSRAIAREKLAGYKTNVADSFLTGSQSCLP